MANFGFLAAMLIAVMFGCIWLIGLIKRTEKHWGKFACLSLFLKQILVLCGGLASGLMCGIVLMTIYESPFLSVDVWYKMPIVLSISLAGVGVYVLPITKTLSGLAPECDFKPQEWLSQIKQKREAILEDDQTAAI